MQRNEAGMDLDLLSLQPVHHHPVSRVDMLHSCRVEAVWHPVGTEINKTFDQIVQRMCLELHARCQGSILKLPNAAFSLELQYG